MQQTGEILSFPVTVFIDNPTIDQLLYIESQFQLICTLLNSEYLVSATFEIAIPTAAWQH
jgi:hypothetical protein